MVLKREQKLIIEKLLTLSQERQITDLILTSADAIYYATGYASFSLYAHHDVGGAIAVVRGDGRVQLIVSEFEKNSAEKSVDSSIDVQSYPTWIYIRDYAIGSQTKAAHPDLLNNFQIASEFIRERTVTNRRVAVQSKDLSFEAYQYLINIFGAQNISPVEEILQESRLIKTPWEIDILRRATQLDEIAINKTAAQIFPGLTDADVVQIFEKNARELSNEITSVSNAHTIGNNFAPSYIQPQTRIGTGDIVRLDGGISLLGYNSDLARTFVIGSTVSKEKQEIYEALWRGHEYAAKHIEPGVKFSDLFNGVDKIVNKYISGYVRGHFGHSIGSGKGEEFPFVSPDQDRVFEEGMVINLEVPFYSSEYQSFNIEDTFIVHADRVEQVTFSSASLIL